MSHAYHSHHRPAEARPRQDHGQPRRHAAPRPAPRKGRDYTLAHAGRQWRVPPIAFWMFIGALMIMAVWSAATATYFAFRDDLLTRLIARQADMQYAYEDRVADLRQQIDRLASRQMLDQEQFEQKLEQLIRRQAVLEGRAAAISALPDATPTGSVRPSRSSDATPMPRPSPISDTPATTREPALRPRMAALGPVRSAAKPSAIENTLARLQGSLDRVEARQNATLAAIEDGYESKAKRIRTVLTELGIAPKASGRASATGGPYVPVPPGGDGSFERQLARIQQVRAQVDGLTRSLNTVPVRRPLSGAMETTSSFGVRMDPFLRSPAMHTGLDFRGDVGEAVRATASGKVVSAGWNGGYGKMVEVDHGNGLTTRYGHLSAIDVSVGQTVRAGQVVGRVGSTGRSTGPHLHYETRVDGDAVDPHRFLRAGARLGGLI